MTHRRYRFGALAIAFVSLLAAVSLLMLYGCGRAGAQAPPPTIFIPPGAYTDCGPDGARHPINFASTDPATRWGYCAANPGDSTKCRTTRDSGRDRRARCAREEYEIGAYVEGLEFKVYGCTPPPGARFIDPDPFNVLDAAFAVDVLLNLQCERCNACGLTCNQCPGSRPRPTPSPVPTPTAAPPPTPTPSPPAPTPTPAATPCPTCPPPVECEVCPTFERVAVPPKHARTAEFAGTWSVDNAARLRERFLRLQSLAVWLGGQLDKLYVPGVRSSANISQTLESVEWRCYPVEGGEECLAADALPGEVPMFVPRSPYAAEPMRCGL